MRQFAHWQSVAQLRSDLSQLRKRANMAKMKEYAQSINIVLKHKAIRYVLVGLAAISLLEIALRVILGVGNPVLYVVDRGEAQGGVGYIPAPDQDVRRFFAENKNRSCGGRCDCRTGD